MIRKFEDLVTSIDVLNTIHGGVSEPFLSVRQESERREVRIRVPGVERELIQADVRNGKLSVFYLIPVVSNGKLMQMPQIVYDQIIPSFIDINEIKAVYEESELVIKLPFNKLSSGYNRKVEIGEE